MARVESRSEKRVKNIENLNESASVAPMVEAKSVEVTPKKGKRHFSAKEKLRILSAADGCKKVGELGSMLRREGLYSSHLAQWRRLRAEGQLGALSEKKRGRKPDVNPLTTKLQDSESQVAALTKRLEKAEEIIDVQKKFAALFGKIIALPSHLTEMS